MIYRTNQTELPEGAQEFCSTTQMYKYNELTQKLEEAGVRDDQELIQSSSDCELHSVLERFGYVPPEYLTPDNPQAVFEDGMFPSSKINAFAKSDVMLNTLANSQGIDREQLISISNGKIEGILDVIEKYLKKEVNLNGNAETEGQKDIQDNRGENPPEES